MVSLAATSKKYRGRKAATYETIRMKQQRWKIENEVVEQMLRDIKPESVLDVPVGTGRFVETCGRLGVDIYTGIDSSEEMLAQAAARTKRMRKMVCVTMLGDATKLTDIPEHDAALCIRFLDLIDEDAMRKVLAELCQLTRRAVILTIRLGDKYVPKSNTAEHDRKKFLALVKRLGFRVEQEHPVFKAGWVVMKLRRVA